MTAVAAMTTTEKRRRLSDLVLVMGEREVDASDVNVDFLRAKTVALLKDKEKERRKEKHSKQRR